MCLTLLIFAQPSRSQWSQTFGWGGAGNGKRSISETTDTADDLCSTPSSLQTLINTLQRVSGWCFIVGIYLNNIYV